MFINVLYGLSKNMIRNPGWEGLSGNEKGSNASLPIEKTKIESDTERWVKDLAWSLRNTKNRLSYSWHFHSCFQFLWSLPMHPVLEFYVKSMVWWNQLLRDKCVHVFPTLHLVASCSWFEIDYSGSSYTMEPINAMDMGWRATCEIFTSKWLDITLGPVVSFCPFV